MDTLPQLGVFLTSRAKQASAGRVAGVLHTWPLPHRVATGHLLWMKTQQEMSDRVGVTYEADAR